MMDVMMLTQEGMGAREYNYERTLSSRTQNPSGCKVFLSNTCVIYTYRVAQCGPKRPIVVQNGP